MKPYVYDAQDQMSPVYCLSCHAHIPRAVSNSQAGFCNACHSFRGTPPMATPPYRPIAPIPLAPTPPTIWQQLFVPFANQKYQAELGAYLHATGQVSDQAKKTANAVIIVGGICIVVVMITTTLSILRVFTGHDPEVQKIEADMKRIRKQAEADQRRFEAEQRKIEEEFRQANAEEERRRAWEDEETRRSQEERDDRIRERQRELMENSRNYRDSYPSNVLQDAG